MQHQLFNAYYPGNSVVHRTSLWVKWVFIACCAVATTTTHSFLIPLGTFIAVVTVGSLAGITAKDWAASLWGIKWLILAMSIYYLSSNKLAMGADIILTLLTLIFASKVLLFSTPMTTIIDGFVRACTPLRHIGLSPQLVGLAIALMIRSIPVIFDQWTDIHTAVQARGIKVGPTRRFIPLVIATVAYAHETGEALVARGLDS
mgnify:FL=1